MRTKKSIKELKDAGIVKKASEIPVPKRKIEAIERTALDSIREADTDLENGKRLRLFCERYKTNTEDLFVWLMDNYGKPMKKSKEDKPENTRPDRSNFAADLRKRKCGLPT